MALGLTQPPAEMSTRDITWWQRRPVRRADTLPPSRVTYLEILAA